jgi:sucrose phosphorylase
VDLDWTSPDLLFEFLDIILYYVSIGCKILRLDAVAFLWKKIGTDCLHLPETHEIIKLIRNFLEVVAPDVVILTETNVPHAENISYFGKRRRSSRGLPVFPPSTLASRVITGNFGTSY